MHFSRPTYLTFLSTLLATHTTLVHSTILHVNSGCIDVTLSNGVIEPLCAGISGHSSVGLPASSEIYACFPNNGGQTEVAGCSGLFSWPADYGDVYFGQDNCLYDAFANLINDECIWPGNGGGQTVLNPYTLY